MEKVNLTVVAPVFNEADGIVIFNSRLNKVLSDVVGLKYRIVYVVDKSDDNSLDILREIAHANHCIRVIGLSSRFGHQASLLAGIEKSLSSDAIIMMDSDLQHPPELIPQLLDKFKQGYDIVYTVRLDTDGISWFRKKAGNSFYSLLSYLAGFKIHPNAADFRLISSRVATNLAHQFKEQHLFLRGIFSWMGFNSIRVNFYADKRFAGSSKYSFRRILGLSLSAILSFSTKPLMLGIYIGITTALISMMYMFVIFIQYFFNGNFPGGWTTLIMTLLFFGGIQLIVMGVIGIYIGAIFNEVKSRPRYVVEEDINA